MEQERTPDFHDLSAEKLLEMYRRMLMIRLFDETCYSLFMNEPTLRYAGTHSYVGQEAIAVGVCAALSPQDKITSTHRGHGHLIAKGADVKRMMAEIQGKATGYNKGKGGSMHITSYELGILGAMGVVAAGLPIATGAAFAMKYKGLAQVCVCFFGESAANEGVFHESLNLASVWKLPVVFVCENNLYGVHTHISKSTSVTDIASRALSYGMPGKITDGNDVLNTFETASEAINRARDGGGPSLIECKTYRWYPHYADNPDYRPSAEKEFWKARDPISRFEKALRETRMLTDEKKNAIAREVGIVIEEAAEFARKSPWPEPSEAYAGLFA